MHLQRSDFPPVNKRDERVVRATTFACGVCVFSLSLFWIILFAERRLGHISSFDRFDATEIATLHYRNTFAIDALQVKQPLPHSI